MDALARLSDRLNGTPWSESDQYYSPSSTEMEGVLRCLKIVANLAQRNEGPVVQHVLASPARMLGHVPSERAENVIKGQVTAVPDAYAKAILKNAVEWADMVTEGKLPSGYPVDLLEPLLAVLELGCQFRLSKGFLEVGDKAIPIQRWPILSAA
ncbi:hypothetical protein [Paracidovorax avenae]|uniref:hypothetical protein n=1 Tax=Paracidovorax avenae TaxID=80867 RepID=UPI001AD80E6D|nr:hypothetical protein [Paracidovorax avenae]